MWRVVAGIAVLAGCGRFDFALHTNDAASDAAPDAAPLVACTVAQCPAGYGVFNGGCYRVSLNAVTWLDAELDCETAGGHLAVEDSVAEHDVVHTLAQAATATQVWVGWTDRRGPDNTFTWVAPDMGGLLQSNPCVFAAPEPTAGDADHCVLQMAVNSCGDYQDVSCNSPQSYVCECDGQLADPTRY